MLLIWQQNGDMEHDFYAPPVGIDTIAASEIVHSVQTPFVLVESCQQVLDYHFL